MPIASWPLDLWEAHQRRLILGVLQAGPWTGGNFAEEIGLDGAVYFAAFADASKRGWIYGSELTPEGHEQLSDE